MAPKRSHAIPRQQSEGNGPQAISAASTVANSYKEFVAPPASHFDVPHHHHMLEPHLQVSTLPIQQILTLSQLTSTLSTQATMGSIGTPNPTPRGFVLHKKQIDSIPLENFSDNPKRATGGWKQIFSAPDTPTDGLNLGIAHFPPRTATRESFEALHRHKQAEFYYILSGQALVKIDGVDHEVGPGAALFIPGDSEHGFWNTSDSEELVFLWGFPCDGFRDVVYRFTGDREEDKWTRAESKA